MPLHQLADRGSETSAIQVAPQGIALCLLVQCSPQPRPMDADVSEEESFLDRWDHGIDDLLDLRHVAW